MALILNLETSTQICSVSLGRQGECTTSERSKEMMAHASNLTLMISRLLEKEKIRIGALDAVAVSMGPGSYTGLRIGVSTAKGIAYAAGKKLIGIPTLKALALGAMKAISTGEIPGKEPHLLCPMIDARRMEVYSALYRMDLAVYRGTQAEIITRGSYSEILVNRRVLFFGNGADKCIGIIRHRNAVFLAGLEASAEHMVPLAEESYASGIFEDVAYFEPFYLKDFIPTTPKNKMDTK